jgi:hypothetical protein
MEKSKGFLERGLSRESVVWSGVGRGHGTLNHVEFYFLILIQQNGAALYRVLKFEI